MRYATLKALVEASRRPDEPGLLVPAGPRQKETLETLREAIRDESPQAHISQWDKRPVLLAGVEVPRVNDTRSYYGYYRHADSVRVFFVGEELRATGTYSLEEGVPLAGEAQLRRILESLREKLVEEQRREQKRAKIRKLKERSIETQIEALAAEMRFAYALRRMHTKVKLVVRLDDQNALFVDIPHGRIQEVIPELPPLIETVRDLYRSGARFKVASSLGIGRFREPGPA